MISWKHIEHLFLLETANCDSPGVRLCHKLHKEHVWLTAFSRMRVYLAAQVSLVIFTITISSTSKLQLLKF